MTMEQANKLQQQLGSSGITIISLSDEILVIPLTNSKAVIEAIYGLGLKPVKGAFGFNPLKYRGFRIPARLYS